VSTVWREGGVSVVLENDLLAWATAAIHDATNGAAAEVAAILEPVAVKARSEWYGPQGVVKRTGLSGQIEVITTANLDKGVVTVSVGSTDTRTAGKTRALVPSFVHRPGRLATDIKGVTREEFFRAPASTRIGIARVARPAQNIKAGDWMIRVSSPRASDGKTLLPIYVNKPAKEAVGAKTLEIGATMARNMGRKNG
jgi:hypothetical protein